jgi:protein TonB
MNKFLLLPLLLLTVAISANAQATSQDSLIEKKPLKVVERMPTLGECDLLEDELERNNCTITEILNFVSLNTRYPSAAKDMGVEGTVYIRFVVSTNGKVGQLQIAESVSPELDQEAMRVVSSLPQFNPGINSGETVPVKYMLPIKFTISTRKNKRENRKAWKRGINGEL